MLFARQAQRTRRRLAGLLGLEAGVSHDLSFLPAEVLLLHPHPRASPICFLTAALLLLLLLLVVVVVVAVAVLLSLSQLSQLYTNACARLSKQSVDEQALLEVATGVAPFLEFTLPQGSPHPGPPPAGQAAAPAPLHGPRISSPVAAVVVEADAGGQQRPQRHEDSSSGEHASVLDPSTLCCWLAGWLTDLHDKGHEEGRNQILREAKIYLLVSGAPPPSSRSPIDIDLDSSHPRQPSSAFWRSLRTKWCAVISCRWPLPFSSTTVSGPCERTALYGASLFPQRSLPVGGRGGEVERELMRPLHGIRYLHEKTPWFWISYFLLSPGKLPHPAVELRRNLKARVQPIFSFWQSRRENCSPPSALSVCLLCNPAPSRTGKECLCLHRSGQPHPVTLRGAMMSFLPILSSGCSLTPGV